MVIDKTIEWLSEDEDARCIFRAIQKASEGENKGVSPSELYSLLPRAEVWFLRCILDGLLDYGVITRKPDGRFILTDKGNKVLEVEKSLMEVKKI